ncbi:MAG TPA: hypothetical protein VF041_03160 [Gemmatimonadaceae bacterium]
MQQTPEEQRSTESASGSSAAGRHPDHAPSRHAGRLFPYNTVVGIIDDPPQLAMAVEALGASGFGEDALEVVCGEAGLRRIDAWGERKDILARVFRIIDGIGEERDQTARHEEELRAGHFIVVVDTPDAAAKARARDGLAGNGGHFIHYYSRWETEDLVP